MSQKNYITREEFHLAMTQLMAYLDDKFKKIDDRFDASDAKIDRVEHRLNEKIDKVDEKLSGMIDDLKDDFTTHAKNTDERLNSLEELA